MTENIEFENLIALVWAIVVLGEIAAEDDQAEADRMFREGNSHGRIRREASGFSHRDWSLNKHVHAFSSRRWKARLKKSWEG